LTTKASDQRPDLLITKYNIQVPRDVATSAFMGQPKVPVLLSRAAFRPINARNEREDRSQFQQGRRKFLHTMLGVAAVSIAGIWLLSAVSAPNHQPTSSSVQPSSPGPQISTSSSPQPVSTPIPSATTGQILANAANIPPNQSLTVNDPTFGPIVLIHLDNGQFVAYSAICTHAGCEVQFDSSAKDIVCPCHGAIYDAYNNAQVVGGPAPYPLQKIPIQYDTATGNLYLTS